MPVVVPVVPVVVPVVPVVDPAAPVVEPVEPVVPVVDPVEPDVVVGSSIGVMLGPLVDAAGASRVSLLSPSASIAPMPTPTTASTVTTMIGIERLRRPSRASSGRTTRIGAVSSARIADGGAMSSIVPGGAL